MSEYLVIQAARGEPISILDSARVAVALDNKGQIYCADGLSGTLTTISPTSGGSVNAYPSFGQAFERAKSLLTVVPE